MPIFENSALKLDATLKVFSDTCNYINQTVDPKLINKPRIQGLVDRQQREEFSLSANHDININAAVKIPVAAVALGDEQQTWSQAQDCFYSSCILAPSVNPTRISTVVNF